MSRFCEPFVTREGDTGLPAVAVPSKGKRLVLKPDTPVSVVDDDLPALLEELRSGVSVDRVAEDFSCVGYVRDLERALEAFNEVVSFSRFE